MLDTSQEKFGCRPINIGTGRGSTVLEMVSAMEKACGHKIPVEFSDRREGDTEAVWAATGLAEKVLSWKARFTVEDMCRDQWNWAKRFPRGYEETVEMMRPVTLLREMSFDVFNGDDAAAAAAAAAAATAEPGGTEAPAASAEPVPTAAPASAGPASAAISSESSAPGAVGEHQGDRGERRTGIFREVHEVNANGVDGVHVSGRKGIRGAGGTISKVIGKKAGVVPVSSSPASKTACAVALG